MPRTPLTPDDSGYADFGKKPVSKEEASYQEGVQGIGKFYQKIDDAVGVAGGIAKKLASNFKN